CSHLVLLADCMIYEVVYNPLVERFLDAICGLGTFVFHAVRRYLEQADANGLSTYDAIAGVVEHVFGMDIHPVAVALARVTYLLAIGSERLQDRKSTRLNSSHVSISYAVFSLKTK